MQYPVMMIEPMILVPVMGPVIEGTLSMQNANAYHYECNKIRLYVVTATTRIFGYIQYVSRNDKYPVFILWALTTMTTLVNR